MKGARRLPEVILAQDLAPTEVLNTMERADAGRRFGCSTLRLALQEPPRAHGKEVGALAGLTPTPYQSGDYEHELGISRSGNRWVRGIAIDIAWGWLRHQPQSALTRWYEERFARGGPRARKIGIVALARKLLVALCRYLETGALPEGAELKS